MKSGYAPLKYTNKKRFFIKIGARMLIDVNDLDAFLNVNKEYRAY